MGTNSNGESRKSRHSYQGKNGATSCNVTNTPFLRIEKYVPCATPPHHDDCGRWDRHESNRSTNHKSIKSRHRFALRGQCESFLCTIESVRRANEHLSHTTLHENFMIERQVGSQDSQERSFARIPNHTNHRGSSQLVASACERADAVERLGGQVRAHSRNYDVDSRTQCRVTQWNDGGGIRLHARRWIHGGTADTLTISKHERPSFMQFQHRKRGARQAARGSDMTVRMFHKKYCSNT